MHVRPGFSLSIVIGGPELVRGDRRIQYVIANGRRLQDFGLQQALEYGVQGWFPNGSHPVGAVYLDIDPALADFNIHPAKREARFKDPQTIHHAATEALREFMRRKGLAESARALRDEPAPATIALPGSSSWGGAVSDGTFRYASPQPRPARASSNLPGRHGSPDRRSSRIRAAAGRAPQQAGNLRISELPSISSSWSTGERLFLIVQHAATNG
jgi:DNA mismatch repair ATPase MutL